MHDFKRQEIKRGKTAEEFIWNYTAGVKIGISFSAVASYIPGISRETCPCVMALEISAIMSSNILSRKIMRQQSSKVCVN